MVIISFDHIKTVIKSAIASATRYKPNLEVTDPDDPRYVAGKLSKERIQVLGLAPVAKTGSYNDLIDKPTIPTDSYINSLIDAKIGEIENGSY